MNFECLRNEPSSNICKRNVDGDGSCLIEHIYRRLRTSTRFKSVWSLTKD